MSVFNPLYFNFHHPAEHVHEGKRYDLEMHLHHVYADSNGRKGAIMAVWFDREAGGSHFNPFITQVMQKESTDMPLGEFLGGLDMSKYYNYNGSLTEPPCTEGIKWTIIEQVQPISDEQVAYFERIFAFKNVVDDDFVQGGGERKRDRNAKKGKGNYRELNDA